MGLRGVRPGILEFVQTGTAPTKTCQPTSLGNSDEAIRHLSIEGGPITFQPSQIIFVGSLARQSQIPNAEDRECEGDLLMERA